MKHRLLPRLAAVLLATACGLAAASQVFLFPIEQVEGLGTGDPRDSRPLIDAEMRALLVEDVDTRGALHRALHDALLRQLQAAYPGSIVNAAQIATTRAGGTPAYVAEPSCGQGFRAPLGQSYAVVVGISRASRYKVERLGGVVEALVPVTLNLQLIKPDAGKIVSSLSDTRYTSFKFTAREFDDPAAKRRIVDALMVSMPTQVAALVAELKSAFQPRDTAARVLGTDRNAIVIDKGFESGLEEGVQIEATHRPSGKDIAIRVLSTASGYSVVKSSEVALRPGDELMVTTGAAGDDSRKPRVLPVTGSTEDQGWTSGVAELFSKQIGFKAPFQILPADVHFAATLDATARGMRCLDSDAQKAMKKVSGERTQEPNFFLRFERADSPRVRFAGLGNVQTRDTFITSLSAQLVDRQGDVIFSALGSDTYQLDRVAGQGIAVEQAREIALKNATEALTRQVLEKARLETETYRIERVDGNRISIRGPAPAGDEAIAFEVLRPLKVKVGATNAVRRLAVEAGAGAPVVEGGDVRLDFVSGQAAEADDRPQAGDELRLFGRPAAGRPRHTECRSPYQPSNGSMTADDLLPLIRHASYGSSLYRVNVGTPGFVRDANALLKANLFGTVLEASPPTDICLRAAYLVRQEPLKCESPANCSGRIKVAPAVLFVKADARAATYSQNDAITLEGFGESEAANFMGLKAHEQVLKTLPNLTTSLNLKK